MFLFSSVLVRFLAMTGDVESHGEMSSLLEVGEAAQDLPSAAGSKTKDYGKLADLVRQNMHKSMLRRTALTLQRQKVRESVINQVKTPTQQQETTTPEVSPGRRRVRRCLFLCLCTLPAYLDLIYIVLLRAGSAIAVRTTLTLLLHALLVVSSYCIFAWGSNKQ